MNSFNQPALGQFQANCANYQSTGQVYQVAPAQAGQQSATGNPVPASPSLMQFASPPTNFVTFQPNYTVNCVPKEVDSLKKQNGELQNELEKLRSAYTDCNYQIMASNMKLNNLQEQIDLLHKEKLEQEKAYKELRMKYDEKFALFRVPHQSEERSLFCDQCNFEVKSQVALFIHKLNHHFESSIPRHLQLSTRSFSTMPDDSIRFKYKCHCCEIDSSREFARHEIYVHIYQFHTFDTPFKCKFCFLYFTSQSYLNDHLVEKHSLPSRKGKRKSQEPKCDTEQLNSTLSLSYRPHLNHLQVTSKRAKNNHNSTSDLNELFQQLVGESLDTESQPLGIPPDHFNSHQQPTVTSSMLPAPISKTEPKSVPNPRETEIQQIMIDLEGDDNLNCKYPGCKFVASTKNHLKFHISAHLMSKYKCPYCTFVGNRIAEIKRHILKSSKHTDQHVYLCPDCDFASDCEKTFRDHYGRCHNSQIDVNLVIERMFANESNKVGQNFLSTFKQS